MTTTTKPPATRGSTLGGRPRPRRALLHERTGATPTAAAVRQVLVVDVCNLGLGAMTAALLEHHGDGRVRAKAVGTDAVVRIDPSLRWVMAEAGVPLPTELHGSTSSAAVEAADVVVAVGPRAWAPGVDGPVQDWIIDAPVHGDLPQQADFGDDLAHQRFLFERAETHVMSSTYQTGIFLKAMKVLIPLGLWHILRNRQLSALAQNFRRGGIRRVGCNRRSNKRMTFPILDELRRIFDTEFVGFSVRRREL